MIKELNIKADVNNLDDVLEFIDGQLESIDCPLKIQTQIDLAVEEIFVNIASYAYADYNAEDNKYALIKFETNNNSVSITFIDNGMKYNPLEKPDPDITLPAEERPIGGLGIFMVKKIADEIFYDYVDGKNVFTLKKNIN